MTVALRDKRNVRFATKHVAHYGEMSTDKTRGLSRARAGCVLVVPSSGQVHTLEERKVR